MNKLAVLAAGVAVAGLAACTGNGYYNPNSRAAVATPTPMISGKPIVYAPAQSPTSTVLTSQTTTFHAGPGTVESVALVHIVPAGTITSSASTGATIPGASGYRVTVRMDDGTYQAVDQDNRGFMVGDRVSFEGDGRLTKQ
jgi:hypothetical protein